MVASHVHEALRQVQEIRRRVLRHQIFQGYSGVARISGGILCLLTAFVLAQPWYPRTPLAHLVGWGTLCTVAFLCNFVALMRWHRKQTGGASSFEELRPVVDVIAPLLVGGLLTFALIRVGHYDLLFGSWMTLFGLANVASRHSLPEPNFYLGWIYIVGGAVCLLFAHEDMFLNPWPMGLVFFGGEVFGGSVFLKTRQQSTD